MMTNYRLTLLLLPLLSGIAGCGAGSPTGPQRILFPPRIISFTPEHGPRGSSVRIEGAGFGREAKDVNVTFGGAPASVARIDDEMILTTVPEGATTGPIVVTRLGASVATERSFRVSRSPGDTILSAVRNAGAPQRFTALHHEVARDRHPRRRGAGNR